MSANVQDILLRDKFLSGQNDDWRSYFQDLADFCLPRKAWITTVKTKGERLKFNFLYDSTAIRSAKIMAAGFHHNLTNPSSKWFAQVTRDPKLMKDREVQLYFHEVEEIIFSVLAGSNFDTTFQEFYMDAGVFGTGTVLTLDDPRDKVRFTIVPVEQLNFEEDAYGRICAAYRNFKLTAMQAFMLWGQDCGKAVLDAYKDRPFTDFDFLHYVGPRKRRDVTKSDNLSLEFESVWIQKKENHLIGESGFYEFPYAVGRFWKDANDVFGFSPAMDVLADIKLVNAQQRTLLRAAMKQADPPMQAPSKGYMLPLNFNPAAMNYRSPDVDPNSLQPIPVGAGNLPITIEIIKMVQDNIEQGFFVPLFRAISDQNKQMTIPEVQRRISENMVLLGPVVGRFMNELIGPTLTRVFNILYRNGDLPDPPAQLQGKEFDFINLGALAMAQRQSEVNTIGGYLQSLGQIAQYKPGVLDKVNEDKTAEILAKVTGVNPEILHSDKEVKTMRDQRAQAAAAQMQLEALHKGAAIAETAGKAGKHMAEAERE